jgi:hypothetical protein
LKFLARGGVFLGGGIPPREDLTFKSQVLKDEITVPTDAPPPGEAEPSPTPAPDAAAPVAVAPAPEVTPTTVEPPLEPVPPPVAETAAEPLAEETAESPPEKPQAQPKPPTPPPAPAKPEPKAPPEEVAKPAPPASKPAPAEPARSGTRITTWIVQVGNFSTRAKADAVASQLRSKGLEVFVEPIGKPASVFRVAVGPEAERSKAAALIPRVEAALPGSGKPFIRSYP